MVAGHLQTKKGYYYIVLNMRTDTGARKTKWIATGIPEGGKKNLKQAEELLAKTRYTYEDMVIHTEPKSKTTVASDILFADYMIKWLSIIKNSVEVDTYAGYVNNVKKRIAPYFRELGVTLKSVTALDIENFYSYCRFLVHYQKSLPMYANCLPPNMDIFINSIIVLQGIC